MAGRRRRELPGLAGACPATAACGAVPAGAYCDGMRSALFLHQAAGQLAAAPAQQTAGWLRWFVVGAVTLVVGLAWFCLRGYRGDADNPDGSDQK